jgi:hypothetical protein
MTLRAVCLAGVAVVMSTIPTVAHHSFAMFDGEKTKVLEGTVKEFPSVQPAGVAPRLESGCVRVFSLDRQFLAAEGRSPLQYNSLTSERARVASARSEIRLVGNRKVLVEQVLIVLGADILGDLAIDAPIVPHSGPRLVEGVRVGHRKGHLQHLAVVNHFPALENM